MQHFVETRRLVVRRGDAAIRRAWRDGWLSSVSQLCETTMNALVLPGKAGARLRASRVRQRRRLVVWTGALRACRSRVI
jgi:hypothetical protein